MPLRLSPGLVALAGILACASSDRCLDTPVCEEGKAVNCEPSCQVGPCSTGVQFTTCGEGTRCQVQPGRPTLLRFTRARAVCAREDAPPCDPSDAGPPTCNAKGEIAGCSPYKAFVTAPCNQANLYFEPATCCGSPFDGGSSDAG